ncbi:MAG TPA: sugar transferase, partial [Candidatus Saccharimonadales bacterium]|nr:sugar transferase [Candidatus Saccharimonadales bacterium]
MAPLVIRHVHMQRPPEETLPEFHGIGPTKRALDILLAGGALLVTLPLWLLIALAIKLDSRGPVFYRQERVGQNRRRHERRRQRSLPGSERREQAGPAARDRRRTDRRTEPGPGRLFRIVKFRSMRQDAEAAGPVWAVRDDPRVTRVGRLLRRSR